MAGSSCCVDGMVAASAMHAAFMASAGLTGPAAIFEGQFSSVTNSYAGKGVVRYAW